MTLWRRLFSRHDPEATPPPVSALASVLQAFVNARTADEKRAMLKAHPAMLGPEAEKIMAHSAGLEENKPHLERFEQHRRFLELCREIGVDAAFTPVPATPPGTPLGFVFQAFVNTPALDQKKAFLKAHPELLSAEAGEILARGANERTQEVLDQYSRLLELCRKSGIDAAFAELELQQRHFEGFAVFGPVGKVIGARSLAEMEAGIRQEPRVFDRDVRDAFKTLIASHGTRGLSEEWIQACLGILESCERNGVAATFASLNAAVASAPRVWVPKDVTVSVASDAEPNKSFGELIRKFASGHSVAELVREANRMIPDLPILPRRACMVLAMICSSRAGDSIQARQWAVRLDAQASEWGVPGLPSQSLGPVVIESTDFDPILDTLHWLARGEQGTEQERSAIGSLLARYAAARKPA